MLTTASSGSTRETTSPRPPSYSAEDSRVKLSAFYGVVVGVGAAAGLPWLPFPAPLFDSGAGVWVL